MFAVGTFVGCVVGYAVGTFFGARALFGKWPWR